MRAKTIVFALLIGWCACVWLVIGFLRLIGVGE